MRYIVILGMVLALAACGGVHRFKDKGPRASSAPPAAVPIRTRSATGPISQACLASDRKARSRALCGCIQAVANVTLTGSQQRRAARFYGDPQKVQDIKMSDRASNEAFWEDYKTYASQARKTCS